MRRAGLNWVRPGRRFRSDAIGKRWRFDAAMHIVHTSVIAVVLALVGLPWKWILVVGVLGACATFVWYWGSVVIVNDGEIHSYERFRRTSTTPVEEIERVVMGSRLPPTAYTLDLQGHDKWEPVPVVELVCVDGVRRALWPLASFNSGRVRDADELARRAEQLGRTMVERAR